MKRYLPASCIIIFFILMLLFPQPVFQGASAGLLLWFDMVLPTLLPFIIVSNLLIQTRAIHWIARILAPVIGRFFGISSYGTFAVLTGFLCGYPMGGKVTADLVEHTYISREEGCYLLSFCNNTSPMFIISYVIWHNLSDPSLTLPSMTILVLSPILCSFLFREYYTHRAYRKTCPCGTGGLRPNKYGGRKAAKISDSVCPSSAPSENLVDTCIMNGFESITKVGGYIILFSILLYLMQTVFSGSLVLSAILMPSMEITNGIPLICRLPLAAEYRYILAMALTSFGGWCSVAQTKSMIQKVNLPVFPYIVEKLITALVTSLLAYVYITFF